MTNRRKVLLSKLLLAAPTETERQLMQLSIERICADMCDFYDGFYAFEGPGAIVYAPKADKEENTMFYLTVSCLISALNDFTAKEMEGPADIMRKAIARAEALDVEKEALFILQDEEAMSLIHYKRDNSTGQFVAM